VRGGGGGAQRVARRVRKRRPERNATGAATSTTTAATAAVWCGGAERHRAARRGGSARRAACCCCCARSDGGSLSSGSARACSRHLFVQFLNLVQLLAGGAMRTRVHQRACAWASKQTTTLHSRLRHKSVCVGGRAHPARFSGFVLHETLHQVQVGHLQARQPRLRLLLALLRRPQQHGGG
jgi:hypothetical protein